MMNGTSRPPPVLHVVVYAAPPPPSWKGLVSLALNDGWLVRVISTPIGERFIDVSLLAEMTGDRVRIGFRMPDEPTPDVPRPRRPDRPRP
jgi:hypothetical protein